MRRVVVEASAAFNQGAGIGRYARRVVPAAERAGVVREAVGGRRRGGF